MIQENIRKPKSLNINVNEDLKDHKVSMSTRTNGI